MFYLNYIFMHELVKYSTLSKNRLSEKIENMF